MNNEKKNFCFEMLVLDSLDPTKKTRYSDALSLLYALRSVSKLWQNPSIKEKECKIADGATMLAISDQTEQIISSSSNKAFVTAFSIVLSGDFKTIEPMRISIVEYLKAVKFEYCYVTKDEISENIACELYPFLYRVENKLRRYLTRFMTTRFGGQWWELTASEKMNSKANDRKRNEVVFGKYIDNSSFLIDFNELGELIFKQASGFVTTDNIKHRVMQLPEDNTDALKELKKEIQSNYHKFFKETFADKDFKSKWNEWFDLRNKIAHTNLFTENDLIRGKLVAEQLLKIIEDADNSPDKPDISQVEREAIQEQIIAQTDHDILENNELKESIDSQVNSKISLTEEIFLKELAEQQNFYSERPNGFVGLLRFLKYHLTELGYRESEAEEMLYKLKRENKIEVYYVDNPYVYGTTTAALRSVS